MPRADKTKIVVYRGQEYAKYAGESYYRNRTFQHAPMLHRQIYIDNYGEIPEGFHIHHIDGNTENNSLANLVAISHGEHTKETLKQRWGCAVVKVCDSCGKEFRSIRKDSCYCSKTCAHREWRRRNADYVNAYIRENKIKRRIQNAKSE